MRGGGNSRGTVNRVWRRGDQGRQSGPSKRGRHVSFNDKGGGGGGPSGGGIKKRLRGGPNSGMYYVLCEQKDIKFILGEMILLFELR